LAGFLVKLRPDIPVSLKINFDQPEQASGSARIFGRIFCWMLAG
jgi:hypothetical protein